MKSTTDQICDTLQQMPPASRLAAWLALTALVAAWIMLDVVIQVARDPFITQFGIAGTRAVVATRALFNVGLMWVALAVSTLILRARGQALTDIGWRRPSTLAAWCTAAGLAVLYAGATLGTVGASAHLLSDWSFYCVSLALVLGVSSGVCGEAIFRGFVITQARDAGCPTVIQVLLSAVLFGVAWARFGWAGTRASPGIGTVVAVVAATAVVGAFFAVIYLLGRRSLMPAIAAHTGIDMVVQPGMLLFLSGG